MNLNQLSSLILCTIVIGDIDPRLGAEGKPRRSTSAGTALAIGTSIAVIADIVIRGSQKKH